MHPIWIQKIEERRKTAVITFWVSMTLVVIIPLLLILKGDAFLILAMLCFTGAAIRVYWKDEKEIVDFTEGARKEADSLTQYRLQSGVYHDDENPDQAFQPQNIHPELLDEFGNRLEPEQLEMPVTDEENFFNVSMDNGQPLKPDKKKKKKKQYASADDMELEDPATHPTHNHPFASGNARLQAAQKSHQNN